MVAEKKGGKVGARFMRRKFENCLVGFVVIAIVVGTCKSFSQDHRSMLSSHIAQPERATLHVVEHQQAKVCDANYLASPE